MGAILATLRGFRRRHQTSSSSSSSSSPSSTLAPVTRPDAQPTNPPHSSPTPMPVAVSTSPTPLAPTSQSKPISITYSVDGCPSTTETFDYLIVACDPRGVPVSDRTSTEQDVVDSLVSYTFRTSLFKAKRPAKPQLDVDGERSEIPNYAVRFNPAAQLKMDGSIYGFRDEVFARRLEPSSSGVSWCMSYQLEGAALYGRDETEVARVLDGRRDAAISSGREEDAWVDFKPEGAVEEDALVDYFPHFEMGDLERELPWIVRDAQGEKQTFYVASFTCFESVLHCYLYGERLMDKMGKVVKEGRFPVDKNAKFAVLGAGPSGLLFASQQLAKKGYDNFKIFERTDRFGGKCLTYRKKAPADPEDTPKSNYIPCELGTCYLSPAYEPMFDLFEEYDAGKIMSLERGTSRFRGIVDAKVAKTQEEKENGVDYDRWIRELGDIPFVPSALEPLIHSANIAISGAKFSILHFAIMGLGINDCMPEKPPTKSSARENLRGLIARARAREQESDSSSSRSPRATGNKIDVRDLWAALSEKNEEVKDYERKESSFFRPRGLFAPFEDIGDVLSNTLRDVTNAADSKEQIEGVGFFSEEELESACNDVFSVTIYDFLAKHGMLALYPLLVYTFSVQGYGSIETTSTYYGMIWITPGSMLKEVRDFFDPPEKGSTEDIISTVNIVDKGWLTLFEKIVEKDLAGKIVLNANIEDVQREL